MSRATEELIYLILQFLYDKDFKEAAHMLGCETGLHFDMKHFEDMVLAGEFDDAESYLSWFTSLYDNKQSTKVYFELRKQKFLEALDKNNRAKALNILIKDLKVFPPKYEESFKEMTQLLTINNTRENKSFAAYKDAASMRKLMMDEIKLIIHANPVFIGRLELPAIKCPRLLHLLNKSFKCQHLFYEDAVKAHDIGTLLEDHVCKTCLDLLPLQSEGNTSSDDESDTSLSADSSDNPSHVTDAGHFYTGVTNPVGTDDRTMALRDVDSGKKLFSRKFSNWDVGALCTSSKAFSKRDSKVARSIPTEESPNQTKLCCNCVYEICKPSQLQFLQSPLHAKLNKIEKVTYSNVGRGILVLSSNGNQVLWKWPKSSLNLAGMATTKVCPQFWQPKNGLQCMRNELLTANTEDKVSYFSVSKNDSYLIPTSGGEVSLFNLVSYKALTTFFTPPPVVTCFAFYPRDNNIFAIGMVNSSIVLYHVRTDRVLRRLKGHSKRVTAVAFSSKLNLLISADVNGQIISWSTIVWEKQRDRYLQMHGQEEEVPEVLSETDIQFNKDQTHFLAVNHTHLGIYEATELRCVSQLAPEVLVVIKQAAYSSDGKTVYAIIADGNVAIFDALNFQMWVRIRPSAYLFPNPRVNLYPTSIAANPQKPTQFAVGLTDGSVCVIEPLAGDSSSFALDGVSKFSIGTSYMKFK